MPHSPGAATSSRWASGANTAVFPEPEAPVTMKSGRAVRAQHRPHFARRRPSGRPLASRVSSDFASAHAGRPPVCHKAAARQGRQVTESEVALRWRVPRASPLAGDRHGCRPGRRYVRHARGSLPGGDHRFSCPPPPARAYGPALLFLVAAWTWPARAHVRTCRAGAERSRLSLRAPGTASKGVTGIAWPGAARETGGGARNDRAGHAGRASR